MEWLYIASGIIAIMVFVYLIIALFNPEKF
ncbi:MAG: K(+)-transporting ATPase subunit F [Neisseriales bacterium]|nr:MAG: K(+)-transporting ATPase subunit F [Neisseriales bacterium]